MTSGSVSPLVLRTIRPEGPASLSSSIGVDQRGAGSTPARPPGGGTEVARPSR